MKKYLITGALALVTSATFISCHTDEDFGGSIVEQKMQAYQEVFEEEFGKVDPNQDWGFGTAELLARTRAAMSRTRADGEFANVHGEYADANLWTSKGFHAPDPLTPGQKLRVQFYFQTVKNPGNTDDHGIIDFFMQQVYDGATDPITNYTGYSSPAYSLEEYPAANGREYIQSGEHMDHLVAGDDNTIEHINNFNNGNFPNPNTHVANWNQTVQDDPDQEHTDQIMLMLNTPTKYFSYANSEPSNVRKDRWRLVSGDVIDRYCDTENNTAWKAFLNAHPGVQDDPCYDDWERSYIGFDYDMLPSEDLYATIGYDASGNIIYDPNQTPARTEYVYFGIPLDQLGGTINQTKVWNGTALVNLTTVGEIKNVNGSPYFYPYKRGTTEKINVLTEKQNMYCGTPETWEDREGKYVYTDNGTSYVRLDYVYQALDNMKMPVKDNHRSWVAIGNCADGYYSDWIVSFLPATPVNEQDPNTIIIPIEPGNQGSDYKKDFYYKQTSFDEDGSGRVFCEDLGVVRASDIDFNDIVFDVYIYKTEYITEHMTSTDGVTWVLDESYADPVEVTSTTYNGDVWLLAGGGTIPASIQAGDKNYSVKDVYGDPNITDKWIINTIEDDEGRYGNLYKIIRTGVKLNEEPLDITSVADVDVFVTYEGHVGKLVAFKGAAPHKICVPIGTKWLKEREEINLGYPSFTNYVKSQDKNGKYIDHEGVIPYTGPEGGYIGDGNEYNNNYNRAFDYVWVETEETSGYLYQNPVSYTPRHEASGWDGSKISQGSLEISDGSSVSGYQKDDPVLIRRRH